MTLYLWSHWFWITSLFATIISAPIGSVDTVSSKLLHNSRDYSKREPLKFPVAVQSDTDDIFDGGPGQESLFKTEWFPQISSSNKGSGDMAVTVLKKQLLDVTTESLINLSDETNTNTTTKSTVDIITPTVDYSNESSIVNIKLNSTDHDDYSDEQFLDEDKEDGPGPARDNDTSNENERGRQSKKILADYREKINLTSESKSLLARSAAISVNGQEEGESEAFTVQDANILDAGAISGICFAVIGLFCGISFAVVAMYRRRYLNAPQTLSEPDSSGYIDDSTIRDNSDEMYSLDNDSFLNSLEAMTIQNYWTDSVKHTKL